MVITMKVVIVKVVIDDDDNDDDITQDRVAPAKILLSSGANPNALVCVSMLISICFTKSILSHSRPN